MPKTNKNAIPFHVAVRGYVAAKFGGRGMSTASRQVGKGQTWLSNILQSKGYTSRTVETLYTLLPELKTGVQVGAVQKPPRIKRPGAGRRKAAAVSAPPAALDDVNKILDALDQVVKNLGPDKTAKIIEFLGKL